MLAGSTGRPVRGVHKPNREAANKNGDDKSGPGTIMSPEFPNYGTNPNPAAAGFPTHEAAAKGSCWIDLALS